MAHSEIGAGSFANAVHMQARCIHLLLHTALKSSSEGDPSI